MAFKMKGWSPIRKTKPVVEPAPVGSDAGLVSAGRVLGKSHIPEAIDFRTSYDASKIKWYNKEDDKDDNDDNGENNNDENGNDNYVSSQGGYLEADWSGGNDDSDDTSAGFTSTEFSGNPGDPYKYRTTEDGGYEYKDTRKKDQDWTRATHSEAIEAIRKLSPVQLNKNKSKRVTNNSSVIKKIDDRIFNNAIPGGTVQNNMINNGYEK